MPSMPSTPSVPDVLRVNPLFVDEGKDDESQDHYYGLSSSSAPAALSLTVPIGKGKARQQQDLIPTPNKRDKTEGNLQE